MALEPYGDHEGNNKALVVVGARDNAPALRALAVGAAAVGTLAAGGIALGRALSKASSRRTAVRQEGSRAVAVREAGYDSRDAAVTRVPRVSMVVGEEGGSRGRAGER